MRGTYRVLRALGWAGATPPAYAARVWGLWAGGCRMWEAVLSVERGRMHVGLRTVGVPCVAPWCPMSVAVPYIGVSRSVP